MATDVYLSLVYCHVTIDLMEFYSETLSQQQLLSSLQVIEQPRSTGKPNTAKSRRLLFNCSFAPLTF